MLFALIVMTITGIIVVWMGILIWKKEKISLIHSYHYTRVKENNVKAYTEQMGKGVTIIGSGMILSGIIDYATKNSYGWIVFVVCFVLGFVHIIKAQKKYNGRIF
ncbi:DUF3784 domain-containing protein [Alkalibaculum sp. M08DMB]|uniref:DUF3784 domain-containing protein n=1 Tax=Alkalibaculum sporogenes TaxID=2655001 RepID=A0A6A7K7T8_9FIRM|nr:DUF3784 domain-containing protein [Alkalibaculum sporogenes]MPW25474.1 DUF3784 domain-containing protein [Alkalibaculum sporogenes]